ncbi:lymphocyte antigen 6D-like [Cebus imitator]|uniref:Lymphocyte antigen 6D-like isoform X1 n=1 Tax=Sapajus apella TaxID=9515 RepID=A0A6J3FZF8_SAPAP|nr:lymphocyte antigen 6D-like isoform X1 [Sapajus apella]XP_037588400.1 lymphocyte antigen 6D-like [Cebus imitator]
MRTHLSCLLPLLLVCSAQALTCHECSATGDCFQPTVCRDDTRYCLTTLTTPPGHETIVIKSCAYSCPGYQESLAASRAFCCNTDLCNSTVSLRVSWGLLALSICVACLNR